MALLRAAALASSLFLSMTAAAQAQSIGTFQWRTDPFCNLLTLTVSQNGNVFTLDGFDQPCGDNPRMPVHGIAVTQDNGSVTLGVAIVPLPGGAPINLEAAISLATLGGTWRDSAGNAGILTFAPAGVSGGPRPIPGAAVIPNTFVLRPDGGFVAGGTFGQSASPIEGPGTRMMWSPRKAAFRAGQVTGGNWNDSAVGRFSVAFGDNTLAQADASVAFGSQTGAAGVASVAMGSFSLAVADNSIVLGDNLTANGVGSVVLGTHASTTVAGRGSFVFGDRSTTTAVRAELPNQFVVRAVGGVTFTTATNGINGCAIASGSGNLSCSGIIQGGSDRTRKQDIAPLDGEDVLRKIATMPVTTWSFVEAPTVRHAGPMAQDFRAAFGLGDSETSIAYTDINGINMRAIQALEVRTSTVDERTRALEGEIAALRARLDEALRMIAALVAAQQR